MLSSTSVDCNVTHCHVKGDTAVIKLMSSGYCDLFCSCLLCLYVHFVFPFFIHDNCFETWTAAVFKMITVHAATCPLCDCTGRKTTLFTVTHILKPHNFNITDKNILAPVYLFDITVSIDTIKPIDNKLHSSV